MEDVQTSHKSLLSQTVWDIEKSFLFVCLQENEDRTISDCDDSHCHPPTCFVVNMIQK